jgi:hypothetical protein
MLRGPLVNYFPMRNLAMRNSAKIGHMQHAPAVNASIDGNLAHRLSQIHSGRQSKAKGAKGASTRQYQQSQARKIAMGISRTLCYLGQLPVVRR